MALILIVEDDDDSRGLARTVVESIGHEAVSCGRAEEVEVVLQGRPPDMALLDINLPERHGVSLAWHLRTLHEDLPIIIVSAVLEHWEQDDLFDCGADLVVPKPYRIEQLQRAIDTFLKHGRAASSNLG